MTYYQHPRPWTLAEIGPKNAQERTARLDALGYVLTRWQYSLISRRKHAYKIGPSRSGGAHTYLDTIGEVDRFIVGAEQNRCWQGLCVDDAGHAAWHTVENRYLPQRLDGAAQATA